MLSVSDLPELLACSLSFLYFLHINGVFFQPSPRYRRGTFLFWGVLYVSVLFFAYDFVPDMKSLLFAMLILLVMSVRIYSGSIMKKSAIWLLFYAMTLSVTTLSYQFFISFYQYNYLELTSKAGTGRLYVMLFLFLTEGIVLLLFRFLLSEKRAVSPLQKMLIFVFFLITFSIILIAYFSFSSVHEEKTTLYSKIFFLVNIFMIIGILLIYCLMKIIAEQNLKYIENRMLKLELSEHKKELELYQQTSDKVSMERHNLKNRLLNYKILLEQNKSEEVLADISQVIEENLTLPAHAYCSDPILNALLLDKSSFFQKNAIEFETNIQLSKDFHDLDFLLIIETLLDNAIEASLCREGLRKIIFELIELPLGYSLIIQNAIDTSVLRVNPELETTKSRHELHGYGLKSVKQMLAQRNGLIEIYEKDHYFTVHVIYY